MVSERDKYFFDLRGYLLLKGAISPQHIRQLNAGIDALLPIEHGEWKGYVHGPHLRRSRRNKPAADL